MIILFLFFRYNNDKHKCPDKQRTLCSKCARPAVSPDDFKKLSLSSQAESCLDGPLDPNVPQIPIKCTLCETACVDGSCFNVHVRRCDKRGKYCKKCNRYIVFKDVYKDGLDRFDGSHRNCSEVYCSHCEQYINHEFLGNKNAHHTCFIKPVEKAPTWPRGIIAFDLETTPTGKANLVTAVFPKQSACPASGVGLKIFSDFSLDDYDLPYPLYKVPQEPLLGEKYIHDHPSLGLPAMDISHFPYLYQNFPYGSLIPGSSTFATNTESQMAETQILRRINKEEGRTQNFPFDRSLPSNVERLHPLNIHTMSNIHSDPSKTSQSFVNEASRSISTSNNCQQHVQDKKEPKSASTLRDLLKSVDQEEDFINKAYNLQPQLSEIEARQQEKICQRKKKKIPKEVEEFLDMEADASDKSESISESSISSDNDECMSFSSAQSNVEDIESDCDLEENIVPCRLSKKVILSDTDSECESPETSVKDSAIPSLITGKILESPADEREVQSTPLLTASSITDGKNVLMGTMVGTIPNEPVFPDTDENSSLASQENLSYPDTDKDTNKTGCAKKCCSPKELPQEHSFEGLEKHPEALCDHCYELPMVQASPDLALHQFLKWINQSQFYGFVCVAHFGSKFDLPVSLNTA